MQFLFFLLSKEPSNSKKDYLSLQMSIYVTVKSFQLKLACNNYSKYNIETCSSKNSEV